MLVFTIVNLWFTIVKLRLKNFRCTLSIVTGLWFQIFSFIDDFSMLLHAKDLKDADTTSVNMSIKEKLENNELINHEQLKKTGH